MEEWRDIEGYEKIYQVSNYGRMKSVDRYVINNTPNALGYIQHRKEKLLTMSKDKNYFFVRLSKNGKTQKFYNHILVAKAFIPNPNNYEIVHHKDHNPLNNRVENLEWMDKNEHCKLHQKEHSKTVYQYTINGELVNVWFSLSEAAKQLDYNQGLISACCNGLRKTHKGFKWSYEPLKPS